MKSRSNYEHIALQANTIVAKIRQFEVILTRQQVHGDAVACPWLMKKLLEQVSGLDAELHV